LSLAQLRAARDRRAAKKLIRVHWLPAGTLQFEEPDRAVAASHGQCVVKNPTGLAGAVSLGGAENLDAAGVCVLKPRARKRRKAAATVVNLVPRLRPVDPRFGFLDLGGVSTGARLRRQRQFSLLQVSERANH